MQSLKLTFIGATHEVTGSCTFLEACGKNILIDCGMEQGINSFENVPLPVAAADIDMVFLTHAHIDHSGKLPLLYKNGFRGQIFATCATERLCRIMLRDSAHIQMFEAEWRNRKAKRSGKAEYIPLYTVEDAEGVLKCFVGRDYEEIVPVADGISIRFVDAGHLLGSSSIEVWISEEGIQKKIVFSGDIGNLHQPIIRDPHYIKNADYVVMESTYGDRSHGPRPDYIADLTEIIQKTFDRGGNVVIPAFAVGRTQEMLYFIRQIKEEKRIKNHDNFEVYVDSPLAVEATKIFMERMHEDFDDEASALIDRGVNPISFPGLKTAVTSDDSKAINFDENPKVIISASGMCDAGRIKHHLKHNLWRPESTILFVGYQSVGTLGRAIVEGAKQVKLFGEEIEVRAEIRVLAGVSGHADREGLLAWILAFEQRPQQVFVVHGEDASCTSFAERVQSSSGMKAMAPYSGTVYDLAAGSFVTVAQPVPAQKKAAAAGSRQNTVFDRLLAAGQRLLAVIRHNEGGANKDLAKFADQINALCDKWER
ncbi:metallo-beta-lactamase domain protein [Marvinbryantia formatexigens DSM 14469]|uniref:Metallo-beta-lactamase domain protein n=1 Tax=Marvinbryantia formatexigens DSM 14469 TaxID=478749 RepID=C6LI41_9FIRM|nr:MBL fold metallo-hydrolase [Marvinbryantia formatexigens]EET59696.1 metallo-beta-lactamase domain protein [Marvinbryantia formatexigens DSM 14469]SDG45643.1 metallo-beta-lactamase family protein [Marvinbryantia formatexigens]